MSTVKNVHDVKCPWGKLSMGQNVLEAKCPWGKISMWQNVHGAKCHGLFDMEQVVTVRVIHWASCDVTSGPGSNFTNLT
jgi:hypothetical protein